MAEPIPQEDWIPELEFDVSVWGEHPGPESPTFEQRGITPEQVDALAAEGIAEFGLPPGTTDS